MLSFWHDRTHRGQVEVAVPSNLIWIDGWDYLFGGGGFWIKFKSDKIASALG